MVHPAMCGGPGHLVPDLRGGWLLSGFYGDGSVSARSELASQ